MPSVRGSDDGIKGPVLLVVRYPQGPAVETPHNARTLVGSKCNRTPSLWSLRGVINPEHMYSTTSIGKQQRRQVTMTPTLSAPRSGAVVLDCA